jgi:hypothetical protein
MGSLDSALIDVACLLPLRCGAAHRGAAGRTAAASVQTDR